MPYCISVHNQKKYFKIKSNLVHRPVEGRVVVRVRNVHLDLLVSEQEVHHLDVNDKVLAYLSVS